MQKVECPNLTPSLETETEHMTLNIPSVEFNPQDPSIKEFEIFELDSIYRRASTMSHDPGSPHRLKFNLLVYIREGVGTHFVDFNHYPYTSGSFISISRNQINAFDFKNKPQGSIILYTPKFEESIRSNIRLPALISDHSSISNMPVLPVSDNTKLSCEALLEQMRVLSQNQKHSALINQLIFSSLTLVLLAKMPSRYKSDISAVRMARFLSFITLLEEHFMRIKDANAYAELLGMTYKSLNQICKSATARSPKQLIDSYIILEAKRRLAIDNTGTDELAFGLGFDDASNFTKYFKAKTSLTPTQFKKSIKS